MVCFLKTVPPRAKTRLVWHRSTHGSRHLRGRIKIKLLIGKRRVFLFGADGNNGLIAGTATYNNTNTAIDPTPAGQHAVLLTPLLMAVDANRDGTVSYGGDDMTSSNAPYRFWLNDDQDTPTSDWPFNDQAPEQVPPQTPDSQSSQIVSMRDLEDWTRLWIKISGMSSDIKAGKILVGLKWKTVVSETPSIKIVQATDSDGGLGYIKDSTKAQTQIGSAILRNADPSLPNRGGYSDSQLQLITPSTQTADFIFPTSVWSNLSNSNSSFFLFEGITEGKGELEIVFLQSDGKTLMCPGGSVWLDLLQIKKMYDRGHSEPTNDNFGYPYNTPYNAPSVVYKPGDTSEGGTPPPIDVSDDEADELIVFVHGICITLDPFTSYSATMYKRLWWSGYKGRFAAFQWSTPGFPTATSIASDPLATPAVFNNGEFHAWNCGPALAAFVNAERALVKAHSQSGANPIVGMAAHSLGNVVANSAYKAGLTTDYYCPMEAAISLSCFYPNLNTTTDPTFIDPNDPLSSAFFPDLLNAESPGTPLPLDIGNGVSTTYYGSHTPDVYRGVCEATLQNVTTKITNYHNAGDFWLKTGTIQQYGFTIPVNWLRDQYYMKPLVFIYGIDPVTGQLPPSTSPIESKLYGWNLTESPNACSYRDDVYSPTIAIDPSTGLQIPITSSLVSSLHRPVTDSLEQMSFIARSRTLALGAQSDAGWASLQNAQEAGYPVTIGHVDMSTSYRFNSDQRDHSGQFNRSIQELSDPAIAVSGIPFYDQLREDLTGTPGILGNQQ